VKIIKDIIRKCSECSYYIDKMWITGISAYYKDENGKCKSYMVCGKTTEIKPITDGNSIPSWCPLEDYREADHENPN